MPSKRSFFNPTLFKKNLSRSWPLWGGVTLIGSLFPLYLLLNIMNHFMELDRVDFASFLYQSAAYFLPAFTCFYAILVAMFVWSYLHNTRAVGMMHSLSVSRTNLFITTTLSGLAMLLIPYVVVGGALCVIAACCGALHGGAVLTAIAAVLLDNLLFFGMGTLCAAVTGNVFAVAVFYLVLNFAAPALDFLINNLAQEFIFGLTNQTSKLSILLSPVVSLYDNVDVNHYDGDISLAIPKFEGFGFILVYGIVGILMLALAWLLYRSRRSESAGDVVAFSWLRPVFRIAISVASALTLGRVIYELFWASLFQEGDYANIVPMGICMALTAIVGYYAATMLLEKSLRVFKGSGKGVALVCTVVIALCAATSLDLLGIERYVPDAEDVKTAELSGNIRITCDADEMPGLLEEILALHSAIVEDADYIKSFSETNFHSQIDWTYNSIVYTLKDGSKVEREYILPVTYERTQDISTFDGKLLAITRNPDALLASVSAPEGADIVNLYVEYYDTVEDCWQFMNGDSNSWNTIYEALLLDAREGNFTLGSYFEWDQKNDSFSYDGSTTAAVYEYSPTIGIEFRLKNSIGDTYFTIISHSLQPTMKHTMKALVDCDLLTQEVIDSWSK